MKKSELRQIIKEEIRNYLDVPQRELELMRLKNEIPINDDETALDLIDGFKLNLTKTNSGYNIQDEYPHSIGYGQSIKDALEMYIDELSISYKNG